MQIRNKVSRLALAVVFGVVTACDQSSSPTSPRTDDSALVERLVVMGFDRASIEDRGDYFIVEGDIEFLKAALAQRSPRDPMAPSLQYHNGQVSAINSRSVHVFLSSNLTGNWKTIVRERFPSWHIAASQLRFVEVFDSSSADITVRLDYTMPDTVRGYGRYPVDGKAGDLIRFNGPYPWASDAQKSNTAAHELGHNIGLAHTNDIDDGGSVGSHIPNTPTDAPSDTADCGGDCASLMLAKIALLAPYVVRPLSYFDRLSVRYLYWDPVPSAVASAPEGHPTLSWPHDPDGTYTVEYKNAYSGTIIRSWTITPAQGSSVTDVAVSNKVPELGTDGCNQHPQRYYVTVSYPEGRQTTTREYCFGSPGPVEYVQFEPFPPDGWNDLPVDEETGEYLFHSAWGQYVVRAVVVGYDANGAIVAGTRTISSDNPSVVGLRFDGPNPASAGLRPGMLGSTILRASVDGVSTYFPIRVCNSETPGCTPPTMW